MATPQGDADVIFVLTLSGLTKKDSNHNPSQELSLGTGLLLATPQGDADVMHVKTREELPKRN
jgi:hypothetical protein